MRLASQVDGLDGVELNYPSLVTEETDGAKIDGCSEFRIYGQIVLPVIEPAIGALAIFVFMGSWNSFMAPLIFMRSDDMVTVPVGLSGMVGEKSPEYGMLMAGSILSILPLVIVFFRMQRELVAGPTLGAVKGPRLRARKGR